MKDVLKKIAAQLIDLIFPPQCLICGRIVPQHMCGECLSGIKYIKGSICVICGKPRDGYFHGEFCEDCSKSKPPFLMARSAAIYKGIMKEAIHKFKFEGKRSLAAELGKLLADHLKSGDIPITAIDVIIPVPLSSAHERARGYNQSELLAREIAGAFNIKLDISSLKKIKNVRPQFELKRGDRLLNVKGAYRASAMTALDVLLIDDIYTTGATVSEASLALRTAGAKNVHVLTLARTACPEG